MAHRTAPAVLARAAASLDLLSGGRFELGLGAGGFWDAIEAMGGRRLAPGEAVAALSEAIEAIRGTWDVESRERFVVDRTYYRVDGAKRGPAPAHDVELWLGGLKPRMLGLTGRKADGWLPSLPHLESLDALAEANARIDAAAGEAGRDPREVRRMLNVGGRMTAERSNRLLLGPPEQWAEQLAELALGYGVGAFIVMAEDPHTLSAFGEEVAPAVRALVAAGRAPRS